jgi:hypothetical protein
MVIISKYVFIINCTFKADSKAAQIPYKTPKYQRYYFVPLLNIIPQISQKSSFL